MAPLPIVVGDENMLRQVWMNLLGNAVKYSSGTEPARITVDVKRLDEGGYQFCVADNGAGFDMAYAGKLYLTPADRASIKGADADDQPKSKFAGLLGQTASLHS